MAKMMMGQIDHARARVGSIKRNLIGKAPKPVTVYKVADLANGLRDGSVSFTGPQLRAFAEKWAEGYAKASERYNRASFESIVLEGTFSAVRAAEDLRFETEQKVYMQRSNTVKAEATKVEDAIVLGDNAAALAALTAFSKFTV